MQTELRNYFNSQATLDPCNRIKTLKTLKQAVMLHLTPLYEALQKDLHKSEQESYLTEIAFVLSEIEYNIKHLRKWSRPQRKASPLLLFPSKSRILYQPYGVILIVAPWNYPFRLLFAPLVAAISAGNCVLLKPSHLALHTAAVCEQIIKSVEKMLNTTPAPTTESKISLSPIQIITGGPQIMDQVLQEKYDYIFYTGGPGFGKTIALKAAADLTPVTLELGGKSPCIVTAQANLTIAARRIAWGKFLNSGQTCVAPDYILIESSIKQKFLEHLESEICKLANSDNYGNIAQSPYYGRIIALPAFNRLKGMIEASAAEGKILLGGKTNQTELFIEPTILDAGNLLGPNHPDTVAAMQEEIFGPILPIVEYSNLSDVVDYVNSRPKPLALYIFAQKKQATKLLQQTFSGGACINDTIMHIANRNLPFGGVGMSGMGSYHGKYGFETFSHKKSYIITPRNIDLPLKYPPYKWFTFIKGIM